MGLSITRMHRDAILKVVRNLDAQVEHRKQPQKGERIKVKENAVVTEARLIHWGASNAYYVPMSDQDGPVQKILHGQVERVNKPALTLSNNQLEQLAQDLRLPYGAKQLKYEMKRLRAECI